MFCHCGCGQRTKLAPRSDPRYGWIKGQPKDFVNGHNGRKKDRWSVDKVTGCWNWSLAIQPDGYGRSWCSKRKRSIQAHIHVYETLRGPVADGLELDHLCRNRKCVNPDHLEPVTQAVNIRRGRVAKMDEQSVLAIRAAFAKGGTNYNQLAKQYDVTLGCIKKIVLHQTWKGIQCPKSETNAPA